MYFFFSLPTAWNMFVDNFQIFMKALGITLSLSILGVIGSFIFAIVIIFMRLSKIKILNIISAAYVEIIRGIPLLLQLTVIFILMPRGVAKYATTLIALIINSSAYSSEIIRGGINSVSSGQKEAARSLGLSQRAMMFKIVLPQAFRIALPSLGNEFITLIKETSLASTFYVGDLMTVKSLITATTYDALTPYFIIAVIYFILTFSLSRVIKGAEGKLVSRGN